jgi:hypothetical protein
MLTLNPLAPFFAVIAATSLSLLLARFRSNSFIAKAMVMVSRSMVTISEAVTQLEFQMQSTRGHKKWETLRQEKLNAEVTRAKLITIKRKLNVLAGVDTLQILAGVMMTITSLASMFLLGPLGDDLAFFILISFSVTISFTVYERIARRHIAANVTEITDSEISP